MKTISQLIRETGLPGADNLADWLKSEHPDLDEEPGVPSYVISRTFAWCLTPFDAKAWIGVHRALLDAETATTCKPMSNIQDDWPEMPEWADVMTQDRDGEVSGWGGLQDGMLPTIGEAGFWTYLGSSTKLRAEVLRKASGICSVNSAWRPRIITRAEWEGGASHTDSQPAASPKPRRNPKRKTRKQLKAALKRARRTIRTECARANDAESYRITLDGYRDALLAAQRELGVASRKVKASARRGFFHSERVARLRAEAMGLSMRACKREGIFELTLPNGETYVCPACEVDVYLDGFYEALEAAAVSGGQS